MWMLIVVLVIFLYLYCGLLMTQVVSDHDEEEIHGADALLCIIIWPVAGIMYLTECIDWDEKLSFLNFKPKGE